MTDLLLPSDTPSGLAQLLAGYAPFEGVADEMVAPDGALRPLWRPFLERLAGLSAEELARSMARANQYLRDAGVFFRHYGPEAQAERDWPLSHMPLLIGAQDWAQINEGLIERAELLERLCADIYGPNQLVAAGVLPPELLAQNPEWLRPMVGIAPKSGHYLHFLAFDIGRGPSGDWWVLGDRTQAPSGAGFALETRMATARAFSKHAAKLNVTRLAGFFRAFRDALTGLREGDDGEAGAVAILTPGPHNDAYFEHAYIARYLGVTLAQGEDFALSHGRLMLRTVGGLRPVSVLWRRVDGGWCDPLELEPQSALGTPGLVGALRAGALTMVNALGSGALEIRALQAFMPQIAQYFNGAPLKLPNIATWWCHDAQSRAYVKNNLARMTLDRAMSCGLPFDHSAQAVIKGRRADGEAVSPDWIDAQGGALVAQEIVSLSTTPAFEAGRLVPRPMSLRVFLARTPEGWVVMPGGFARVGPSGASADIAMHRGGSVCDVWVLGESRAQPETLLGAAKARAPVSGALPSRAADNLFWLGRYVERAEQKLRLLRAWHLRLAEMSGTALAASGVETGLSEEANGFAEDGFVEADLPVMAQLSAYLRGLGLSVAQAPLPAGVLDDLRAAEASAGRIRDRFSTDGWSALLDLRATAEDFARRVDAGDDAARALSVLLRKVSGFSGLVHENMYRFTGWRFLSLGRAIERAIGTTHMLAAFCDPEAPEGSLDLAIEAGESIMTHRRLYAASGQRETVFDLLLLDPRNPRSVLHQIADARAHLEALPKTRGEMSAPMRRLLQLETELVISTAGQISAQDLTAVMRGAQEISDLIAEAYLR